jgi:beta-N-acetylhexosaminidase
MLAALLALPAHTSHAETMPDGALAAQVIMTGIDGCGALSPSEQSRLRAVPAGAVLLFGKNLATSEARVRQMNIEIRALVKNACGIAPFIACDQEGGAVQRVRVEAARLPAPAAYWEQARVSGVPAALETVYADAAVAARALSALGITLNLAPVAEPLTVENAAFLSTRSYGPDIAFVSGAARAFVAGMASGGVLCVVKHFPGNTGTDPHTAKPVWKASGDELRRLSAPFFAAVTSTPQPALMVSHVVVPAWDAAANASLSPRVVQILRKDYGFDGVIIADDFSMGAASGTLETSALAVTALQNGVDMVMAWPANLEAIHRAILAALRSGALKRSRLEEAANRLLKAKQALDRPGGN